MTMNPHQVDPTTVEQETEKNGGIPNLASSLTHCVGNIQETFGNAFGKMEDTLKQSVMIMTTMNEMMELLFQQSLHLESKITYSKESCSASAEITARNSSKLDIPNLTLTLSLDKMHVQRNEFFINNVAVPKKDHSFIQKEDNLNVPIHQRLTLTRIDEMDPSDLNLNTNSVKLAEPFTLLSYSTRKFIVTFNFNEMCQCNALLDAGFLSPGTGRLLKNQHEFGIYMIHQSNINFISKQDLDFQLYDTCQCEILASSVRQILRISPLDPLRMQDEGIFCIGDSSRLSYIVYLRNTSQSVDRVEVVCGKNKFLDFKLPSAYQLMQEFILLEKTLH